MLYHVIPCYTMLYHVIPCYTSFFDICIKSGWYSVVIALSITRSPLPIHIGRMTKKKWSGSNCLTMTGTKQCKERVSHLANTKVWQLDWKRVSLWSYRKVKPSHDKITWLFVPPLSAPKVKQEPRSQAAKQKPFAKYPTDKGNTKARAKIESEHATNGMWNQLVVMIIWCGRGDPLQSHFST